MVTRLLGITFLLSSSRAVIYEMNPMPYYLQECFDQYEQKTDLYRSVGNLINWECIQKCSKRMSDTRYFEETDEDIDWFLGLVKEMDPSQPCNPENKPLRVRREIRTLKKYERDRLFQAMRDLKDIKYGNTTRFDFISTMHAGDLVPMAHFGSNFLPWHRFYILLVENALRQLNPKIAMPYWDTGLDSAMLLSGIDPVNSILWGDKFLGNGDGEVTSGPFANWSTSEGPLVRNYGSIPDLFLNNAVIDLILTQIHLENISSPFADPLFNVEFYHGAPHVWLNGHMAGINTAAWEPAFFFYHCFVDFIFEKWWQNAKAAGVDVENEWPDVDGPHSYNSTFGFDYLTNIQGMSSYFTSCVYTYAPQPTCSHNDTRCRDSRFLRCNTTTDAAPFCRSKSRNEVAFSRQEHCDRYLNKGVQNTFCCDGNCTTANWVYIPVEVVQYRPPEFKSHQAFPVINGSTIVRDHDIYFPEIYPDLSAPSNATDLATYGACISDGPHDVIIETTGLSYKGHYQEIAIPDSRLPLSKTTAYIAVRKPDRVMTQVFISASDSCGRVCKVFCRDRNNNGNFRQCSGAFAIIKSPPFQYAHSIEEIIHNMWNIQSDTCPYPTEDEVFIRIFCDFNGDWIWTSGNTQTGYTQPPQEDPYDWIYNWLL